MIRELEERKAQLRNELEEIEERLEDSLHAIVDPFESFLPSESIRRSPLFALGVALMAGFFSGIIGFGKGKFPAGPFGFLRRGATILLTAELKRLATRKAIGYLSEWIRSGLREGFGSGAKKSEEHPEDRADT